MGTKKEEEKEVSREKIVNKSESKSPWFGFKYRVNPETSELLQKEVFKAGGMWRGGQSCVITDSGPFIYVTNEGVLSYDTGIKYFEEKELPEKVIDIDPETGKLIEVVPRGASFTQLENALRAGDVKLFAHDDCTDAARYFGGQFVYPVKPKEEKDDMSNNRRKLNVKLWDNDESLDVEFSLVGSFDIVTEDNNQTAKEEIIYRDNAVKEAVEQHNAIRGKQVDLGIRSRTGTTVFLQPVKLTDLTWDIKEV